MKLHWSPRSPYVRKVMVVAHELDLVDRLELIRSVAAMLKPNEALMRDNPLSKIPTLVLDDGRTLMDSVVICEYLNELAKGSLFPARGDAKWQALRWQALANGLLDAAILWRNERERDVSVRSVPLMTAFDLKVRATITLLDSEAAMLSASPLSIGPITIACALGYLDFRFDDLAWRGLAPALSSCNDGWQSRPSLLATVPDSVA